MMDAEKGTHDLLGNQSVREFTWDVPHVSVADRKSHTELNILENVQGSVRSGELLCIMGPSGSGKTTLLNVIANRSATSGANVEAKVSINGKEVSPGVFRRITAYVEQEDTLIGSLTVRETLDFAGQLALKSNISSQERKRRVQALIAGFGLTHQANSLVGTPIQKGISGGQKRRLSIASHLITGPRILFLDEPTSGLDSTASFEVISLLKSMAKELNLLVIASIHQPSTAVFNMFDKLLLLSKGKTAYLGPTAGVRQYFDALDFPVPSYMNPAEYLLNLVNIDFAQDQEEAERRLATIWAGWTASKQQPSVGAFPTATSSLDINRVPEALPEAEGESLDRHVQKESPLDLVRVILTLIHRSFIKSYRDVFAYGIRLAMYLGLAILMGTVWLRLRTNQESIQSFINAIFFGGAFMSFMAVAYIPAFLEDRSIFVKERANGLYGPAAFMIANFIVGVPYLFIIDVVFSIVSYWLTGFQPTAHAFFMWILWLFLDLLAAESLVVLLSSLLPIFVVALAAAAFANGLWMAVGGFLVPETVLNVFWKYWAHYIDFQAYVFQGMMVNEFKHRSYSCGADCNCMYQSELAPQCRIAGTAVLDSYGYGHDRSGEWIGILIAIIVVYRLLGYGALWMRRT